MFLFILQAVFPGGIRGVKGKNDFWVFSRFRWFWTILKKFEKELMKFFRLQIDWNGWLAHKKNKCCLFPWCKNDSKAFLKEYPVILILIPKVWTEEMKLFALHISYSTKLWFIHSIPFLFGPDPHFFADPDWAKTSGSVRIRIRNSDYKKKILFLKYLYGKSGSSLAYFLHMARRLISVPSYSTTRHPN